MGRVFPSSNHTGRLGVYKKTGRRTVLGSAPTVTAKFVAPSVSHCLDVIVEKGRAVVLAHPVTAKDLTAHTLQLPHLVIGLPEAVSPRSRSSSTVAMEKALYGANRQDLMVRAKARRPSHRGSVGSGQVGRHAATTAGPSLAPGLRLAQTVRKSAVGRGLSRHS